MLDFFHLNPSCKSFFVWVATGFRSWLNIHCAISNLDWIHYLKTLIGYLLIFCRVMIGYIIISDLPLDRKLECKVFYFGSHLHFIQVGLSTQTHLPNAIYLIFEFEFHLIIRSVYIEYNKRWVTVLSLADLFSIYKVE